jgi:hypothetical protein
MIGLAFLTELAILVALIGIALNLLDRVRQWRLWRLWRRQSKDVSGGPDNNDIYPHE